MPKYRFLDDIELKELEEEFKQFLISNGLHNEEWEALNKKNPDKAIDIVGLFSDLILDKVYDKTDYLLHLTPKSVKTFQFFQEKAVLLGVDYEGQGNIPGKDTLAFITEHASQMKIYGTSKSFKQEDRNKEIHFLVTKGVLASDGKIFEFLKEVKKT